MTRAWLTIFLLLGLVVGLRADFLFWLDGPTGRNNPADPKSASTSGAGSQSLPLAPGPTATPAATVVVYSDANVTPVISLAADGPVNAIKIVGSRAIVGGSFTRVGPPTGSLAVLDKTTGAKTGAWPNLPGIVQCIIPDGAGGWYVGGQLRGLNGQPVWGVVRLDSSYNPVPGFNIDTQLFDVKCLLLANGWLYAAGFYQAPTNWSRYLGRFDPTTGQRDTTWVPDLNGTIYSMISDGAALYVGGSFDRSGLSTMRPGLAAYSLASGALLPWTHTVQNFGVRCMLLDGTTLYLGGNFLGINGVTRNHLAAIDLASNSLTAWDPNVGSPSTGIFVNDMKQTATTIFIAGNFTSVGAASRILLAGVSKVTGLATAFTQGILTNEAKAIDLDGGFVYAGNEQPPYLGRLNATTGVFDGTWTPGAWAPVRTIVATGATALVGGTFGGLSGTSRRGLFAFDLGTGALDPWDPQADSTVEAMLLRGTELWVGGSFMNIAGQARSRLARFDNTTLVLDSFTSPVSGTVKAIEDGGSELLIGGAFSGVGATLCPQFARLDPNTGVAMAMPSTTSLGQVNAIKKIGNNAFLGGQFIFYYPVASNFLTWDLGGNTRAAGAEGADAAVRALCDVSGKLLAGGSFGTWVGSARQGQGLFDPVALSPVAGGPEGSPTYCYETSGTQVYVGGDFYSIQGQVRPALARLNTATWAVDAWNPFVTAPPDGAGSRPVQAVAVGGGRVVAGGNFQGVRYWASPNLIVLMP